MLKMMNVYYLLTVKRSPQSLLKLFVRDMKIILLSYIHLIVHVKNKKIKMH
jgi:hypothetical protein